MLVVCFVTFTKAEDLVRLAERRFLDFKSHPHCTNHASEHELLEDKPGNSSCLVIIAFISSIKLMNSLFLKRAVSTTLTGASFVAIYQARNYDTPSEKNGMLPPYEANFQVPMHCDACVKDISGALSALPGTSHPSYPPIKR